MRWAAVATAPQRLTFPSVAVTSIAPDGSFEFGASSASFTLAASSLFGSALGGSGFGSGLGATAPGGGAGGFATGLGGGGGSEQATMPSARPSARMRFM